MLFKTIIENIKSFFHQEEEFMKDPEDVPVAASDVVGTNGSDDVRIIDKHLLNSQLSDVNNSNLSGSSSKKKFSSLPFSSEQLKNALKKRSVKTDSIENNHDNTNISSSNLSSSESYNSHLNTFDSNSSHSRNPYSHEESSISIDDIRAFEKAIGDVPVNSVNNKNDLNTTTSNGVDYDANLFDDGNDNGTNKNNKMTLSSHNSFFGSFEEFLKKSPYDESIFDGDLVHKMRIYHEMQSQGKEPMIHPSDGIDAVKRRLRELQSLEEEWYSNYSEMKHIENKLVYLEEEIDEKTTILKEVLKKNKAFALINKQIPFEKGFRLSNGEVLISLSQLRRAIINMDSSVFNSYIDLQNKKNDFAQWILDVFNDKDLAKVIFESVTKDDVLRALANFGIK